MSNAASVHPAPKSCGRNRRELDDLRARIKKGDLDNADYFFTNNKNPTKHPKRNELESDDMPRCKKCGCTFDEHLSAMASAAVNAHPPVTTFAVANAAGAPPVLPVFSAEVTGGAAPIAT